MELITVPRTKSRGCCTGNEGSRADHLNVKIGFVWNLIASLVRKLKMTINSQLSVHTRSYIVLVFLDHLKARFPKPLATSTSVFVLHQNRIPKCPFSFSFYLVKTILSMCLLNNNCQWTKHAKDELNVPTQHSTFSHISKN